MQVTRQDLIQICDKFLRGEITKQEVEDLAWKLISNYEREDWSDETIPDILFQWDNEEINYPINKLNMQLWKNRLINGIDELSEYNFWDSHIDKQRKICEKYKSKWVPINMHAFIHRSLRNLGSLILTRLKKTCF